MHLCSAPQGSVDSASGGPYFTAAAASWLQLHRCSSLAHVRHWPRGSSCAAAAGMKLLLHGAGQGRAAHWPATVPAYLQSPLDHLKGHDLQGACWSDRLPACTGSLMLRQHWQGITVAMTTQAAPPASIHTSLHDCCCVPCKALQAGQAVPAAACGQSPCRQLCSRRHIAAA